MAVADKGIDVRRTGGTLVFRALLQDSTGAIVTSGTTTLYLYELQSDGTIKSYDFNDNTFKATALTTETLAMTHRKGNNATTNTGLWTATLATLTGFTVGAVYFVEVNNTGASPANQVREFQYGSDQGDLITTAGATGVAYVQSDATLWKTGTIPTPTVAGVPNVNTKTWNDLTTVALPLVPATAGRTLVVDAAGLADANTVKLGPTGAGTAQTARDIGASVLLSSGTGTGQLSFSSGVVKASLEQILGSAFTEGAAGRIAAAFKQFFNIATPAATMDHGVLVDTLTTYTGNTPQTGDVYPLASGVTGFTAIAGYIDTEVGAIKAKTDLIPAAPASTTNITAGTITTVTNLTNAPTSGDLTATMKTSVQTAADAAITANATIIEIEAETDAIAGIATDTATPVYHADIELTVDNINSQDEYTVVWFKNGVRQTAVTAATIQVVKRSDGSNLIASTAMTQIGSTGAFKYDAVTTQRTTAGEDAIAIASATIDAGTVSFSRNVTRDSA